MTAYTVCPEAQYHGNPFRYCPVKGCGWTEPEESCDARTVYDGDEVSCAQRAGHSEAHSAKIWWSS